MDSGSAAIAALILAALPFFIVTLIVVAISVILYLALAFIKLLEYPLRYWILTLSVILDTVLLAPIAIVSLWVANHDPALWAPARVPVLTFAAILLFLTGLQWIYCQYRDRHS